ncbi:MAG: hypothetical protein BGN96_10630 [Bacteroidales bacterium 45-6]|nr:MAG: hypothetical protein BGN96_10630 [Bacteroidales bacterium 45-6]
MTYISESNKNRILQAAEGKLFEVISDYVSLNPTDRKNKTFVGQCPSCKANKSLLVTPGKNMFGCKNCSNMGGTKPIDFLMRMGLTYPDALEKLAQILNVTIIDETPVPKNPKVGKKQAAKRTGTYLDTFLAGSGLTLDDVRASIELKDESKTVITGHVFKSGSLDNFYNEQKDIDDVLIEYYDLDGKPVLYDVLDEKGKHTGRTKPYVRVRYQFPEEHKDSKGRPTKYRTPKNAGTRLYIPQAIRSLYQAGKKIERLFVQEGEKKAEKCCKHGLFSVGISGIQNLGQNGQIPPDLVKIIQACEVKEVVMLFDSDWDELSSDLSINEDVQKRPRNFFYAARNFQTYIKTLKNRGLYLEIFIGHVLRNDNGDKGVDDLLTKSLQGKEDELLKDVNSLVNEKNLKGNYLQLHKITLMGDLKLSELWALDNPASFAERHKNVLKELPEFKIGRHQWRFNEKGELENTRPIEQDEQYWEEITNFKSGKTTYEFRYVEVINFLQNRGFGRMRRESRELSPYFIHVTPPTVRVVEPYEVRDYVVEFTKALRLKNVLELLFRGGPQYLGQDRLSNMAFIKPEFPESKRDEQLFYFKDICWRITKDKIHVADYSEITHQVWSDNVKQFPAEKTQEPLINVTRSDDGHFSYSVSDAGAKCHILQFLINTSNFTWRKERERLPVEPEEYQENKEHLVSKLCAIGYMLMTCKDRNVSRAVVAMDGRQSEVGKSNGRSGKSIIGEMFKHLVPAISVNGKVRDIEGDQFVWTELTEKTKVVFIDDVRTNFSLEFLFANITGDWTVNYKGGGRITFPFSVSPKIYITTNHALNGEGSSFIDRQWLIAFSDFYNESHKPLDDFGTLFFDEWGFEQWNLLWNLMADCVQIYLRYGIVQAPGERLEYRRMRQQMGENFILWADEYFSSEEHLNRKIVRRAMYDDFFDKSAMKDRKYITPTLFKEKVKIYCEFKGFNFNPLSYDPISRLPLKYDKKTGEPDIDNKTNGVEYFTIGTPDYHFKDMPQETTGDNKQQYKF